MDDNIEQLRKMSGIVTAPLNESKYGNRFDKFDSPFKNRGDKVLDKNEKFVAECDTAELAKELAAILTDIKKMREICDRFLSLAR